MPDIYSWQLNTDRMKKDPQSIYNDMRIEYGIPIKDGSPEFDAQEKKFICDQIKVVDLRQLELEKIKSLQLKIQKQVFNKRGNNLTPKKKKRKK